MNFGLYVKIQSVPKLIYLILFLLLPATGCTQTRASFTNSPHSPGFSFYRDTFAFENELLWDYQVSSNGTLRIQKRSPRPSYFNRCFPLIQSARKFHYHARFDSIGQRSTNSAVEAVGEILDRDSKERSPEPVRISGHSGLRSFSTEHQKLLKANCGTLVQSYIQRGNWRVVFPFTRSGQHKEAQRYVNNLVNDQLPIVHIADLPRLNHALLIYHSVTEGNTTFFHCYDPNDNAKPGLLLYHHPSRTFFLPRTPYYPGGPVNVYEVYRNPIL